MDSINHEGNIRIRCEEEIIVTRAGYLLVNHFAIIILRNDIIYLFKIRTRN
jgi:hypothetical protein